MTDKITLRSVDISEQTELENVLVEINGESLRQLANAYIQSAFSNDFRHPHFVGALSGSKIVGAAAYSEEFFTVNVWGISWVSVLPAFQNQGIGAHLVNTCMDHIASRIQERVTIILNTYPGYTRLYDKLGFQRCGEDHEGGLFMTYYLDPT